MMNHYLKNIILGATQNRQYLVINTFGLATALATVILISLFVKEELNYDLWLNEVDSLYRIDTTYNFPERDTIRRNFTSGTLAPVLVENFSEEVEVATRVYSYGATVRNGELKFDENMYYVDESFFELFDLPMVQGRGEEAFAGTNNIILSETKAFKYFGEENPIGKVLSIDHPPSNSAFDYQVVGVFRDLPSNSHLELDFITLLYEPRYIDWPWVMNDWDSSNLVTYLKLRPGQSIESLEQEFPLWVQTLPFSGMNEENRPPRYEFSFIKVADIHLFDNAPPILSFSLIALLILAVASINYTNLATALAIKRAREVSIRKVLGAEKKQLIWQFLGESILTTMIAMMLSLTLVELVLPFYNQFFGKEISLQFLSKPFEVTLFLLFTIMVGFAGGAYPAFVLSSFKPSKNLNANNSVSSGSTLLRQALVVVQFSISIFLIISTLVIYTQILYSRTMDLGFTKESRLGLTGANANTNQAVILKQQLLAIPGVRSVGLASDGLPSVFNNFMTVALPGKSLTETSSVKFSVVGVNFLNTFDVTPIAGRLFSDNFSGDLIKAPQDQARPLTVGAIINRSLAEYAGFQNPFDAIGRKIIRPGNRLLELNIVGVIDDLHLGSTYDSTVPSLYYASGSGFAFVGLEIDQDSNPEIIKQINDVWSEIVPDVPVSMVFTEDAFNAFYTEDIKRASIFTCFAGLAILISCIGLYALAAFTAQNRTKEIGIRKVHGASVFSIVRLLLKKFTGPVLIANIIAWPAAYFVMERWLENFVYRIDIPPLLFVGSGLIALCIAWVTVGATAAKAASQKPVLSLSYE